MHTPRVFLSSFFFLNDTATTEIYTLSLHDALPIFRPRAGWSERGAVERSREHPKPEDRKSTRLNSSHVAISYAVFCLKKQRKNRICFSCIRHTKNDQSLFTPSFSPMVMT